MTEPWMGDYQTPDRIAAKLRGIPLPKSFVGKTVLDVGCDHGAFSKIASDRGATDVLGLDRGRGVREPDGERYVDLAERNNARGWPRCRFAKFNLGESWDDWGLFDFVFFFSVYHHLYGETGDHRRIWAWLRRQVVADGVLLWEGPVDTRDAVAKMKTAERGGYTRDAILDAAREYFAVEEIGPAYHFPYREVWRCRPYVPVSGWILSGSGKAAAAFGPDRIEAARSVLGWSPVPGTLNVSVLDVENAISRLGKPTFSTDRESKLGPLRWWRARLRVLGRTYDVAVVRHDRSSTSYLEIVAPVRLRSLGVMDADEATLLLDPKEDE